MKYEVIYAAQETVITIDGIKARVSQNEPAAGTAFVLGTVYEDQKGFTPVKVYVFQAISETDAENLKKLAVFFFGSLLNTELYV